MTKDQEITSPDTGDEGRALWRKARQGAPLRPQDGPPDEAGKATLLAAYLDGGLDEAACERVEGWLASDSDALDSLIVARAGLGAEDAPPPALIARAQGLVRQKPAAARGGLLARLRDFLMPEAPLWQPVGLAAALLLACVVGFELGEEGYTDLLADQTVAEANTAFDVAALNDDLF